MINEINTLCSFFEKIAALKYTVHTSDIHGSGVFATNDIVIGEVVALALECINNGDILEYMRAPIAMYVNHSANSNVKLKKYNSNYQFIATRFIKKNDEILTSYTDYKSLIETDSGIEGKTIVVK